MNWSYTAFEKQHQINCIRRFRRFFFGIQVIPCLKIERYYRKKKEKKIDKRVSAACTLKSHRDALIRERRAANKRRTDVYLDYSF